MNAVLQSIAADVLAGAAKDLGHATRGAEDDIGAVAKEFGELARHADTMTHLAGEITQCIESERVQQVLEKVRTLGEAARGLIQLRLEATAGILETAAGEARLLGRLSQLTRAQKAIAREASTLSVVTNIEVARLGQAGAGFQYLADELRNSSESVAKSTKDLAAHTDERTEAVEQMRRMLGSALPLMREGLAHIEDDLEDALSVADRNLLELNSEPERFRECVRQIAAQIAGIVSAVQAQDFTRQQVEHVQDALTQIAQMVETVEQTVPHEEASAAQVSGGLAIQSYQLLSAHETSAKWLGQIRECLDGILRIGAAELAEIGPVVVAQERELASQIARIEALERDCQAGSKEVEQMLSVLTTLMQMVSQYLAQSKTVRDRLQLLSFNSIVEASRLGTEAAAILEVSENIKRISASWAAMTEESEETMKEILGLVEQAREAMNAFSSESAAALTAAQAETGEGLARLSDAAAQVDGFAHEIGEATEKLKGRIPMASAAAHRLEASFAHLDAARGEIEQVRNSFTGEHPHAEGNRDVHQMEVLFGGKYTTEMEREVLRAALSGAGLPAAQPNLSGNDVELF
jgi:methyl-accepting chemotaxis protein